MQKIWDYLPRATILKHTTCPLRTWQQKLRYRNCSLKYNAIDKIMWEQCIECFPSLLPKLLNEPGIFTGAITASVYYLLFVWQSLKLQFSDILLWREKQYLWHLLASKTWKSRFVNSRHRNRKQDCIIFE